MRRARERFVPDEDEAQQKEFRQRLRRFQRFHSFIARVVDLNDPWLEKLFACTSWLSHLLPSRDVPADITVTGDMLSLSAFRLEKKDEGRASPTAGETTTLQPITEFGANAPAEEEKRSLSEIIDAFNERYGTNIREADLPMVHRAADRTNDAAMMEMIGKNPADVVQGVWNRDMRKNLTEMIVRSHALNSALLSDGDPMAKVIAYSFRYALRQARNAPHHGGDT